MHVLRKTLYNKKVMSILISPFIMIICQEILFGDDTLLP